jgi:hypothetical protein
MSWVETVEKRLTEALGDVSAIVPTATITSVHAAGLSVRVVLPAGTPSTAQKDIRASLKKRAPAGVTVDVRTPPEFPFTLHGLDASPAVVLPNVTDRIQEFSVQLDHLDGLEQAYTLLLGHSHAADVVATFALGGIAPLQHVVEAELRTGDRTSLELIERLQRRFHAFPGLSWDPPDRHVAVFTAWLDALEGEGLRLLMFDTTFTGNAIDRMVAVISKYVLDGGSADLAEIRVVGVRDKSRGAKPIASRHEVLTCGTRRVALYVEEIAVGQLVTEDKESLIGYESLRQVLGLEPRWDAGVVEVKRGEEVVDLRGSLPVSQAISDLIRGPRRRTALSADNQFVVRAASTLSLLSNAADREREGLVRAHSVGLLSRDEFAKEKDGMEKRIAAMLDRYRKKAGLS